MKSLRRTCAVAVLTTALAVSVVAGTIHSPGVVSPPPPPSEPATSTPTATNVTTTLILTILSLIRY